MDAISTKEVGEIVIAVTDVVENHQSATYRQRTRSEN